MNFLSGSKSYVAGVLSIVFGALGGVLGHLEPPIAIGFVIGGVNVICLRAGIKKAEN